VEDDPAARSIAAWFLSAVILAVGAVTLAGVLSGLGRQRANGVAEPAAIATQAALGGLVLLLLAVGLARAIRVALGRSSTLSWVGWGAALTLLVWLLWAVARYAVDAS
jgi:hypothetical protein